MNHSELNQSFRDFFFFFIEGNDQMSSRWLQSAVGVVILFCPFCVFIGQSDNNKQTL